MEENNFHLLVSALKSDVDLEYVKNVLNFVKEKQLFECVVSFAFRLTFISLSSPPLDVNFYSAFFLSQMENYRSWCI